MTETNVVLKVEGLQKSFAGNKILDGVSFEIDRGQIKVICGPKRLREKHASQMFESPNHPDKGRVWLEGREITNEKSDVNRVRQRIGFVFQEFNLFNHLTALKNVSIALEKVKKMSKDEANDSRH